MSLRTTLAGCLGPQKCSTWNISPAGSASKALPLRLPTAVDRARRLRRISLERGCCGGKTLRAILEEKLCNSGVGQGKRLILLTCGRQIDVETGEENPNSIGRRELASGGVLASAGSSRVLAAIPEI